MGKMSKSKARWQRRQRDRIVSCFRAGGDRRTGLEPELSRSETASGPARAPADDPRLIYLRSEAWRGLDDTLPFEYVKSALSYARAVVVDEDLELGAVLAFDRDTMTVPVVLMTMWDLYEVNQVYHLATQAGVPVAINHKLAIALVDLPLFAELPERLFEQTATVFITVQKWLEEAESQDP